MNFTENYKRELGKYMVNNRHLSNVDWDNYWSWYYHSNLNEKEALEKSKY